VSRTYASVPDRGEYDGPYTKLSACAGTTVRREPVARLTSSIRVASTVNATRVPPAETVGSPSSAALSTTTEIRPVPRSSR